MNDHKSHSLSYSTAHSHSDEIDQVIASFQKSTSFSLLETLGYGLCWTRPMLELAAECVQRPREIDEYDLMFYIKLLAEMHWVPAEKGHGIEQELRAYFLFAAFELEAPHALGCLGLLDPGQRWVTTALEREATKREEVIYPPGRTPMGNN
jgi:hypothetical protein